MSATDQDSRLLADRFQEEFGNVMEAMADLRPEMQILPDAPEAGADLLWWMQAMDAAPGAVAWVGVAEETWNALGSQVLVAAGIESSDAEELKGTYLETLKQALGALARDVGGNLGRDVSCTDGKEEAPPSAQTTGFSVSIKLKDKVLTPVVVFFSSELAQAMHASPAAPAPAPAEHQETAEIPERLEDGLSIPPHALTTLGLLLDVELPVSVSFGRTQVRMREVMKLISGSIIELDRSVSEPVEIIVNNCVVARGEVVVVEGNYGVRISEVMSRRERLQESRKYLLPIGSHPH